MLVHLTTVDLSLAYLLLPQLTWFRDAGYDVVGVSAPGPHVAQLAEPGIGHVALTRSTRAADVRADVATAREFARICREFRPDIVHTDNREPGGQAASAGQRRGPGPFRPGTARRRPGGDPRRAQGR